MEPKQKYWSIHGNLFLEIKDEIKKRILQVPLDERTEIYQDCLLILLDSNILKMEKELENKNSKVGPIISKLCIKLNQLNQRAMELKQKHWTEIHGT